VQRRGGGPSFCVCYPKAFCCLPGSPVIDLQSYGLGAAAMLALAFCACRRIPSFALASATIVGVFAAGTYRSLRGNRGVEWLVMCAGLVALSAGALLVRAMFTRSVSLRLLELVDSGRIDSLDEDITSRVHDMRRFRLMRTAPAGNTLTVLGRVLAALVAASYFVLRLDV
jgi:hypothetical protein